MTPDTERPHGRTTVPLRCGEGGTVRGCGRWGEGAFRAKRFAPPKYDFDGLLAARRIELPPLSINTLQCQRHQALQPGLPALPRRRFASAHREMSRAGIERCLEILRAARIIEIFISRGRREDLQASLDAGARHSLGCALAKRRRGSAGKPGCRAW